MVWKGVILGAIIGTVVGLAFDSVVPYLLSVPVPSFEVVAARGFSSVTLSEVQWISLITLPFVFFGAMFGLIMSKDHVPEAQKKSTDVVSP